MVDNTADMPAPDPMMVHLAPVAPPSPLRELLDDQRWVMGVARAIAHSPAWRDAPTASIVVREDTPTQIAVIGRFDPAMLTRLQALGWQLRHLLPRMRYVTYEEAERLTEKLAAGLIDRFGVERVRAMSFAAVPRGGHIVLGMLSYALRLPQERLETPPTPGQPLVLVDDIAISGNRLKRWLSSRPGLDQVVVATLFATAGLRRAIESDPRVEAHVGAEEVADLAPLQEPEHADWQERWRTRAGDSRYFVGRPEPVAFAWNEPDVVIWNEVTQREEMPWRLLPPELSLKHRHDFTPHHGVVIQVQPVSRGALRPAADVLYGTFEGATLVSTPSASAPIRLDGTAEAIWQALLNTGGVGSAAGVVAEQYAVAVSTVIDDVESMASTLCEMGILESHDCEQSPSDLRA